MAETKIYKCSCKSDFQDEMYGKNNRVFNPKGKGSSQGDKYVCTVCGKELNTSASKKK